MTQKQIILKYIDLHGSILPAKMAGEIFEGVMFGSETSKRCREMRKEGVLVSHKEGKFEVFTKRVIAAHPAFQPILDTIQSSPLQHLFPVDQMQIKQ